MNREQEMVSIACKAIDDKKALDIKVIDIREVSVIADYFVITSGSNLNQVQAIVDNVEEQLGRAGFEPKQIEGLQAVLFRFEHLQILQTYFFSYLIVNSPVCIIQISMR